MKIILSVIKGPHQGRTFDFSERDTFVVGRASYAHFRLAEKDPYFSRAHFVVEVNPPLCRLLDLSSSNGTFVNNKRVTEVDLVDGDRIRGGDTEILIRLSKPDPLTDSETCQPGSEEPHRMTIRESPDSMPVDPLRKTQREPLEPFPKTGDYQARSADSANEFPRRLGAYELTDKLGEGGMGTVYLARKADGAQKIAIKTISNAHSASTRAVDQFLRESSILRQLVHPNVVRFLDAGKSGKTVFFAMEYVNGHDSAKLVQRRGPLSIPIAVDLVCQALTALDYAHAKGFVHRDIKPANILVFKSAQKARVKLTDFGLARVYQASQLSGLTLHGEMGGSFGFLAPEQITNYRNTTPAADLYSAAATLYFLLTGKLTYEFPSKLSDRVLMILQQECIPILKRRPDLPAALGKVIHQALNRKPDQRYPDALHLRAALQDSIR